MITHSDMTVEKVLEEARKYWEVLYADRGTRGDAKHPSDIRIPQEIVGHLYQLGWKMEALKEQNERWRIAINRNIELHEEAERLYGNLNRELAIACRVKQPSER